MARPLRLYFENAVYHITARGNRKENIFYSEQDKKAFLDKMNETFKKYSFVCYAYCLMDNHYHLFLRTPLANIMVGMHYLNASYTNWFKAKHKIVGVIFQGRYKSILVDVENYALELSAYIHLNPIRAGIAEYPEKYHWSSYLDYIGARDPIIDCLDTSFILSYLDKDVRKAARRYKRFVLEKREMKNPFEQAYKGFVLGNKAFIGRIQDRIKSIGRKREIRETHGIKAYAAEVIINKISESFSLTQHEIFMKRKGNIYRQLALYLIKKYSAFSLRDIGALFDMDYVAVSQAAKRFEDKSNTNKQILRMIDKVKMALEEGMSNVKT